MLGQTTLRPCRPSLRVFVASLVLAFLAFPLPAQTSSNARIVRLSFVDGTVNLHRPNVDEWAKAFINTPIQQGFQLATDANSYAEVEFENGSTARLGQTTSLDFTELSLGPEGNKINRLSLTQGYATFTVSPQKGDLYQVSTPQGSFTADGKSVFRIDLDGNDGRLEVFKGHVQVQSAYGEGVVARKHVLEIRPGGANAYQVTRGITLDAWDHWVEQRNRQVQAARNTEGYRTAGAFGAPYGSLYGWNDLYYYGNWMALPGYGYGWFPFVSSGWAPYTLGRWAYYPGFGYTWISGLPWGWLPFHYGNWIFAAGYGWGWIPGNFGYWSPAVVNWYQGSGWIGWYPYAGRFRTLRPGGCQAGVNCATTVSLSTFQSGGFVSPNTLTKVDPRLGRKIASPTITPTRVLRLPGPVVSAPVTVTNSQNLQTTAGEANTHPAARAGGTTFVMRGGGAGIAPTAVLPNLPPGFGVRGRRGVIFNSITRQNQSRSISPAGVNLKSGTFQLPAGARQKTERPSRPSGPAQSSRPKALMPGTPAHSQAIPRPGRVPLNVAPGANLTPASPSAVPVTTLPMERRVPHQLGNRTGTTLTPPGSMRTNQRGRMRHSSPPAMRPSAPSGISNRSNRNMRNNAPRTQRQLNRGMGSSRPQMQRSGGFGRTMQRTPGRPMQMPGGMERRMGGGMQQPRGGMQHSQGPRR